MSTIAYIYQSANTGARSQAEVLNEAIDEIQIVQGTSLGIENPSRTYIEEDDVIYPTDSLARAVRDLDPDLAFVHIYNKDVLQSIATIQTFVPTIFRAGVNPIESTFSGGQFMLGVGQLMSVLQSFDHLVAPSFGTKRDLRCWGVEEDRITTIPTAIDMSDPVQPKHNKPMAVGSLSGRFSPLKNQQLLVMAVGGVRALDPSLDFILHLTGSHNQYTNSLQGTANAIGVGGSVNFPGFVDPDEDFWPTVAVHCLPSFSERLSQSLLEAAQWGVPSIVSDVGWGQEFETMLTAPPDDPLAWSRHIHDLLSNDARRVRVAREQQEEVARQYSTEKIVGDYRALFENLIDQTRSFKIQGGALQP